MVTLATHSAQYYTGNFRDLPAFCRNLPRYASYFGRKPWVNTVILRHIPRNAQNGLFARQSSARWRMARQHQVRYAKGL